MSIRLFVDDHRKAFDGWTLARNFREAIEYVREGGPEIEEMSLDWYLGNDQRIHGDKLVEEMMGRAYYLDLSTFLNTKVIWLHSSDIHMARKQADIVREYLGTAVNPDCRIRLNVNCQMTPR